jgi:hypothetical protein
VVEVGLLPVKQLPVKQLAVRFHAQCWQEVAPFEERQQPSRQVQLVVARQLLADLVVAVELALPLPNGGAHLALGPSQLP